MAVEWAVMLRVVRVDGSTGAVATLVEALGDALDGGPPVLPLGPGGRAPDADPPPGTAVVIATSGSTGDAKFVALSAAALRASATAADARLGAAAPRGGTDTRVGAADAGRVRWLLALPAEHVAGVQVIVRALLAGAPPGVMDLRPGFDADAFAAATTALGPGRLRTSLVPTQLRRLLDAGVDLTVHDAILVGGAALDPALHARARAAGAPVVATYGMSETAGGCVYDGVPLDGVTVDLEPDGRIRLGGPTLAIGYVGGETFSGWFRTGDLGRLRGGRLEVLGRADDVIVTGGEKVAPAAVERVLAAQPGVRGACVVGIPDAEWGQQVVAAIVADTPDEDTLRAAVRAELGRAAVPRRIVLVAEIPLRGIGKPDRMAVTRLVHARSD